MRVYRCIIDRDAVQKTACEKWAADIPVLRAIYGEDGEVIVIGQFEAEADRSPEEEYERLKRTYGMRQASGVPWAEYVYGSGRGGLMALAEAMKGIEQEVPVIEVPTTSIPKKAARKKVADKQ